MTAELMDGKALAAEIRGEIAAAVERRADAGLPAPALATVLVGDRPESAGYVRNKHRACEKVGIRSLHHNLPEATAEAELLDLVARLNADDDVNGILVQLPLPPQIGEAAVIEAVAPLKDVDAFHPENVGRLVAGHPRYFPCTPFGVREMLGRCGVELAGRHAVIVGRSNIVGKPLAVMLAQKPTAENPAGADCSVTILHSRSGDVAGHTRRADILIAAAGKPGLITPDMVKPGAAVVDVGTNRVGGKWVGDVDPAAAGVAGRLSPVPGGVGPMTVTMLLKNTLHAAQSQRPV